MLPENNNAAVSAVKIRVNFARAFIPHIRIKAHINSIPNAIISTLIFEKKLKLFKNPAAVIKTAVGPKQTAAVRKFEVSSRKKFPKAFPTAIATPSFPGLFRLKNIKT